MFFWIKFKCLCPDIGTSAQHSLRLPSLGHHNIYIPSCYTTCCNHIALPGYCTCNRFTLVHQLFTTWLAKVLPRCWRSQTDLISMRQRDICLLWGTPPAAGSVLINLKKLAPQAFLLVLYTLWLFPTLCHGLRSQAEEHEFCARLTSEKIDGRFHGLEMYLH